MWDLKFSKCHWQAFCPSIAVSPVSIFPPMLRIHLHLNTTLIRRTSWRGPVILKATLFPDIREHCQENYVIPGIQISWCVTDIVSLGSFILTFRKDVEKKVTHRHNVPFHNTLSLKKAVAKPKILLAQCLFSLFIWLWSPLDCATLVGDLFSPRITVTGRSWRRGTQLPDDLH
jgi:hypothetical protein